MRKIILSMVLLLSTMTISAQAHHRADTLNQKYFEAKVREMVFRLNITDEQKPAFVSIYRRYTEEMIAAWGEHQRPLRPENSEEAAAMQKRRMERQQRAQAIRIRYVDEFAKVLNASQLNRFFDVENDIQKKLQSRRRHPRGSQGHGGRRTGRR